MKEHFLLVLENGTVHVLRYILMFWVILLLVFSKNIQQNALTRNTVTVRVTLNTYTLKE